MGTYPATCVVGFKLGSCFGFDFYYRQVIAFIDKFLQLAPYVTAQDCASITGHIMSMSSVLGNLAWLKTRFLYKVIDSRSTWDSRLNIGLHNDCLSEMFFWKKNIVTLNSRNIVPYQAPLLLSFSDASNVACGAYLVGTEEVSEMFHILNCRF